jgi:hypothetical protein
LPTSPPTSEALAFNALDCIRVNGNVRYRPISTLTGGAERGHKSNMPLYRCDILGADGSLEYAKILYVFDDWAAISRAQEIFSHNDVGQAVEVWREGKLIKKIQRTAEQTAGEIDNLLATDALTAAKLRAAKNASGLIAEEKASRLDADDEIAF